MVTKFKDKTQSESSTARTLKGYAKDLTLPDNLGSNFWEQEIKQLKSQKFANWDVALQAVLSVVIERTGIADHTSLREHLALLIETDEALSSMIKQELLGT